LHPSFYSPSIASIALSEFGDVDVSDTRLNIFIRKRVFCSTNHYLSLAVLRQKKIGVLIHYSFIIKIKIKSD